MEALVPPRRALVCDNWYAWQRALQLSRNKRSLYLFVTQPTNLSLNPTAHSQVRKRLADHLKHTTARPYTGSPDCARPRRRRQSRTTTLTALGKSAHLAECVGQHGAAAPHRLQNVSRINFLFKRLARAHSCTRNNCPFLRSRERAHCICLVS